MRLRFCLYGAVAEVGGFGRGEWMSWGKSAKLEV